jgi:hypothetical protein
MSTHGTAATVLASLALALALAPAPASYAAGLRDRAEVWDPPRIVPLAEGESLPTPEELESRGARIGQVLVRVYDVFDLSDPREDNWVYRTANALHYVTRERTVLSQLTFRTGQRLSVQRLAESERVLRGRRYLFDAVVRVARYDREGNVADIEVSVRDVWTLNPGVSYSNTGGKSKSGIEIEELNLLGRGVQLQFGYKKDVDRKSTYADWRDSNLFGSRWQLDAGYDDLSDGQTKYLSLDRPFYSLDARWSVGGFAYDDQRVQTRYDLGQPVDAFQVDSRQFDIHYGWSKGLENGWARRWLAGLRHDEKAFALVPEETPPPELPADRKFVYPFIGIEWIEDAYVKQRNRNQIGRTEDAYHGTRFSASLGYADTAFGSSGSALLLSAAASSGREYLPGREWSLTSTASGRLESGTLADAVLAAEARHYWRIDPHQTFFAGLTATVTERLDPDHQLVLGGEEGLRGYPLRYQTGTSSALLTLEHRLYTDWYPFRLFFVGGAVFFDTGRTWGPTLGGEPPRGWLSDAGLGLRLGNSRSGLGSVVHVDFSYALNAIPGQDRFQITVETQREF